MILEVYLYSLILFLFSSTDAPSLSLRFVKQLCELVPPDCAGDTIIPDSAGPASALASSAVNGQANGSGGANLSRKQLKQFAKRAAKSARRQETREQNDPNGNTRPNQGICFHLSLKVIHSDYYILIKSNNYGRDIKLS